MQFIESQRRQLESEKRSLADAALKLGSERVALQVELLLVPMGEVDDQFSQAGAGTFGGTSSTDGHGPVAA